MKKENPEKGTLPEGIEELLSEIFGLNAESKPEPCDCPICRDEGIGMLSDVFSEAFEQVTKGKGEERHGHGAKLLDQPWLAIANATGNGFLTGQAVKKLMEASSMNGKEGYTAVQFEREVLGAMVYAAFAVIHQRQVDAKKAD